MLAPECAPTVDMPAVGRAVDLVDLAHVNLADVGLPAVDRPAWMRPPWVCPLWAAVDLAGSGRS